MPHESASTGTVTKANITQIDVWTLSRNCHPGHAAGGVTNNNTAAVPMARRTAIRTALRAKFIGHLIST